MQDNIKQLTLYQYPSCPFCIMVLREISQLELDINVVDTMQSQTHRQALITGGGKSQVPCLRIDYKDNTTQWMYESTDIINYLKQIK